MRQDYQIGCEIKLDQFCTLQQVGESSLLIMIQPKKAQEISLSDKNKMIQSWYAKLKQFQQNNINQEWIVDLIAAYDTLLVEYNSVKISFHDVVASIRALPEVSGVDSIGHKRTLKICFEQNTLDFPNDLDTVCEYLKLNKLAFIDAFTRQKYRVFASGFVPYFSYLGELEQKLAVPRLKQPRLKVPAGALAIADRQVAIYPSPTPGGWHIIAYTNFQFSENQHFSLGDEITFVETSIEEFRHERALILGQDS